MRGRTMHNLEVESNTTGAWTNKYCAILSRLISVAHESYQFDSAARDSFVHIAVIDKEKEKRYLLSA